MPKVFISHCSADEALVSDLGAMLQGAIGLQSGTELFYSSGPGSGVPAGKDFVEHIRQELRGSTFVVAVITPSFLQSTFCVAEFGAVWLAAEEKAFFPISVSPIVRKQLSETLPSIHVAELKKQPTVAQLLEQVSDHFSQKLNVEAADHHISKFRMALPAHLHDLVMPPLVPKAELKAAEAKIAKLEKQLMATRGAASRERRRADEILAARTLADAEKRANALPKEAKEAIKQLIDNAREAIDGLSSVAVDVLRYEVRDEYMPAPQSEDYDYETLHDHLKEQGPDRGRGGALPQRGPPGRERRRRSGDGPPEAPQVPRPQSDEVVLRGVQGAAGSPDGQDLRHVVARAPRLTAPSRGR